MWKKSKLVAVVIPVYKAAANYNEQLSLLQCLKVLKDYPIIFIAPEKLDMGFYMALCTANDVKGEVKRFDDHFFSGIAGYNRLMLSTGFYKAFLAYKFILIHQLDAYVFRDELRYWCGRGFGFIGAPHVPHRNEEGEMQFLKGFSRLLALGNRIFRTKWKITHVGNGGLSLRKTAACYRLLRLLPSKVKAWGTNNEDGFFKYWGNLLRVWFRLPDEDTALHFSVEQFPKEALKKMNKELPFGCHAFGKYDPAAWSAYIPGLKYTFNE